MIAAEPYRLFAIEAHPSTRERLAFAAADDGIVLTDDVTPFRERKVRILNGAHTLMASIGLLLGCETVLDAMQHPLIVTYLQRLLFEEIVPSLDVPGGEEFARDVLLRFSNPYLRHALRDITVQHTAKMRVRVVPSLQRFAERTGRAPSALTFGFAAYLQLLRTALNNGVAVGADAEGDRVRELWRGARDDSDATLHCVIDILCRDINLWHADLSTVPAFIERVTEHLILMSRKGFAAALASLDA